jgi:hypothetical protein
VEEEVLEELIGVLGHDHQTEEITKPISRRDSGRKDRKIYVPSGLDDVSEVVNKSLTVLRQPVDGDRRVLSGMDEGLVDLLVRRKRSLAEGLDDL